MKANNLIRIPLVMLILSLSINGFAQQFPAGGYQGGTHGNIKYTIWTGTVDDDWGEPGNWCPAIVPDAEDNVVIPASATVMPEVKATGQSCKSLTLEPGASVEIKPGYTLTVNGREVE
jgi:hypothetical protein